MSNSLTINVPKIVQTRNTLNAVPSGSTAEPDYNVKFVPQTLTEEQQAQARQNIGAGTSNFSGNYNDLSNKPTIPAAQVQSDWNQSDSAAPDYIKNKPTSLGGSAPELDEYFTIYPLGNTTLSAEAGTIDEVWLNGEEITATEDSYSISAGAVARVKATNNVCFNFSNTTDEIWVYVPKGIVLSEPIYGTRPNVNLVYWNISASAQTVNFGGTLWLMTNRLFNGIFTNPGLLVIFADAPFSFSGVTALPEQESDRDNNLLMIPLNRLDEFYTAFTAAGGTFSRIRRYSSTYNTIVYKDYKLEMTYADLDVDTSFRIHFKSLNSNTAYKVCNLTPSSKYNCFMGVDALYQGTRPLKKNIKVHSKNELQPGEYCQASDWNVYFKPYNIDEMCKDIYLTLHRSDVYWPGLSMENNTVSAIDYPKYKPNVTFSYEYATSDCDFSDQNYTCIVPKWGTNTFRGGNSSAQKVVCLNTGLTNANQYLTGVTEYIFTNTTLPNSVFTVVTNANVNKVWLPRATYDLAIVDSNWSAYASKLFPYDELTFGPDNYVEPVVDEFTHNNNMQTQRLKSWVEIFINQDLDICLFRNEGWGLYDENLGKCSKNFPSTLMINGVEHKNDIEFGRQQEDDPEYVKWINFPIKAGRNLIGSVYNDMEIPNLNAVDSQDILSTCEIWAYIMDSSDDFLRSDILGNTASLNVVMLQTCDGLYSNVTGSLGYREGSNVWHWIFQDGNGTGQDGNHFYEFYGNFVYGAATFDNIPSTEITDSDFHCHFYVRQSSYNDFLTAMASKAPNISQAAIIAATTQYDYLEPYGGYKWRMVMPA